MRRSEWQGQKGEHMDVLMFGLVVCLYQVQG
jgi:hypothetical protein